MGEVEATKSTSTSSSLEVPDADLAMASRESEQHAASIRNEAYREALGEIAGELYVEAYKARLARQARAKQQEWGLMSGPASV